MEEANHFFDALDTFIVQDINETLDLSVASPSGTIGNQQENEGAASAFSEVSATPCPNIASRSTEPCKNLDSHIPSRDSDNIFEITTYTEKQDNIPLIEDGTVSNGGETSTSTLTSDQNVDSRNTCQENSSKRDEPLAIGHDYGAQSILISISDLMIRAILFQVNILIRCSKFPIWLTYNSLLFATNPLGTLRSTRDGLKKRMLWVCKSALDSFNPLVSDMLKGEKGLSKLVGKMAWVCFATFYIGIVLSGLLITGFLFASLMMSRIVEEPLQIIRSLNFDYTKASPDALVTLIPCDGARKAGFVKNVDGHVIPPSRKLQLTLSLTLPESEYNRNLGVFQDGCKPSL